MNAFREPGQVDVDGNARETTEAVVTRRRVIGRAMGGALVALLARPELASASVGSTDPFSLVVLLKGVYKTVTDPPDLRLSKVDLTDGSYTATTIYPVFGVPGHSNVQDPIGRFYAQSGAPGTRCAYDLPGGAIAMRFTDEQNFTVARDGAGGKYFYGTVEVEITDATGRFRSLVGGRNHMVDNLHHLASRDWDEYCFCFIAGPA